MVGNSIIKGAKLLVKNLSFKSALLIPTVSTSAFHSTNLFLFLHHHISTNSVAPFSAWKHTHNPQFLYLLWQRANTPKISFKTLYGGQFVLSTELIILNYPVILSHRHSARVSLETDIPQLNLYFAWLATRLCSVN